MIAVARMVRSSDPVESSDLKEPEREQLRGIDPLRESDLSADLLLDALKDPFRALKDPLVPVRRMALRAAGELLATDPILKPKKEEGNDKEKPKEPSVDQAKEKSECKVCCENKKDDKKPDPKPEQPDPPTVIVKPNEIVVLEPIHFDFDKWDILPDAAATLHDVGVTLKNHPEIKKVRVEGHTDVRGTDAYNQTLSEKRMNSAVDHLVNTEKVDGKRLQAAGMGESNPKIANAQNEADHRKNRRVEFHITDGVGVPQSPEVTPQTGGKPNVEPAKGAATGVPEPKGPEPAKNECADDKPPPAPPADVVPEKPDEKPPEEKPVDPLPIVNDEIVVPEILFKFDKFDLTLAAKELLKGVVTTITNHPEIVKVHLHGHTDERGTDAYNMWLSGERVKSVFEFLSGEGIPGSLFTQTPHGERDPIHKNAKTKEQHQANRRVVFKVERGQVVMGQPATAAQPANNANQGSGTKPKPKPQGGQAGNGAFIKLTAAAYEGAAAMSAPAVSADVGGEASEAPAEVASVETPVAEVAPVADVAPVAPAVAPEPAVAAPEPAEAVAIDEAPEQAVETAAEPQLQTMSASADPNDESALAEEVDAHPGRPSPAVEAAKAQTKGKDDIKQKRRKGARRASAMAARIAPKLGLSESQIDVRADDEAAARTAAVGAPGLFADGVVWLDPSLFNSDSRFAQHVLAHELAHVAQAALPADGAATRESIEADANRVANALLSGGSIPDVEVPLAGAATFNGAAPAADEDAPPPPPADNEVAPVAPAAQPAQAHADEEPPPPPPEAVDEDESEVDAEGPLLSFDNDEDEDVPPPPPPEAEANADQALEDVPPPPPPEVDDAPPPPPPIDPVTAATRARLAYEARIVRLNAIVREKADQLVTVPAAKEQLKKAKKILAECLAALAKAEAATQGNFSKFAGWISRASAEKKAAFEAEKAANVATKKKARDDAQALVREIEAKLAALKTKIETMEAAAGGQAGGLINKEAEATAITIHDSLDKIFKDREMVANALLGKSRLQIAQIKVAYFDHYHRELIDDLRDAMNRGFAGKLTWKDGSIEEAILHLGGRGSEGAVKALTTAASSLAVINLPGLHHDFNNLPKMEAALWDLDASERATVKGDPKVVALIAGTTRDWKQVISYLLDGDKVRATAVGLHRSMHGAGTDVAGVYRYLRRTDVDHVAVATAFKELYNATVTSWLEGDFSGEELKRAIGLWNVDESGAAPVKGVHQSAASVDRARDLKEARGWFGSDWFNNPKVIVDKLNGMTAEDRAEMITQFGGQKAFEEFIGRQLDDKYWQMAESILRKGDATGVYTISASTASDVLFDTKDASKVLYLLQGKSRAEVDAIRVEFLDFDIGTLDAYLMARFDGIKRHKIAVALQGEPKTPEELLKVAMMRYDFERGGGSNWFSTFWMYVGRKLGMSEAGLLMDREWSEIQELTGLGLKATDDEIAAAVARLGAADTATVAKLGGRIASDAERYREAKDALTKCLVLGTSIAVGSIVTILSAGTLSPFVAGLLGAVAGSGAALAAKKGVQGAAYGASEFKKDAIIEILLAPLKAAFVNVSFFGTIPEGAGPITEMLKILTKDLPGPNWTQELVNIAVSQGLPRLAGPVVKALLAIPVEMFQPDNFVDILTMAKKKADAEQAIVDRGGRS